MRILHTMIRVKNLDTSIEFYEKNLDMKVLEKHEFEEAKFTLVYLGYDSIEKEACLELTYNWDDRGYELGTGYGHIAIEVDDVYELCNRLKSKRC